MLQEIKIPILNKNIKLEAEVFYPDNDKKNICVLLAHPHSLYGGNMSNNVVSSLFSTLSKENIPTLRFNFRGVGKSTGSYGRDIGEQEDVRTCIKFLIDKEKFEKILIIGYSYGAAIGCSQVNTFKNIMGYVAIAFPFDLLIKLKNLAQTSKPKLFIQGDMDNIANFRTFLKHFEDMKTPKEYKIVNNADHFFLGFENQVSEYALNFVRNLRVRKKV